MTLLTHDELLSLNYVRQQRKLINSASAPSYRLMVAIDWKRLPQLTVGRRRQ